ncbi:MAG: HipA domain-containing protein [Bacteroidales bacterium]|nr:HipA domain-containing protein [Bacteroidales bacterium]
MQQRCLYCYKPLNDGEVDFHPRCSKKLFGTAVAPELPYTRDHLGDLAREVIRAQTTLTGVQPKLSLDLQKTREGQGRLTIVGALGGHYILKPQTEHFPYLPEVEDLSMHLAEALKIETVPHSLIRFADGELSYITRRIDRSAGGRKLAMEDMCQLSERLTEDKYKGSHERIARLIQQHSSVAGLDLVKYWEQVVFSFVIGNADMHLKNYSLYSPDDQGFVLTPAYDLLSTQLVMPEDPEELALTVAGKKRKLRREHFVEAMTASGLAPRVIDRIFARYPQALPRLSQLIAESFLPAPMQSRLLDIITTRLQALAL